MLIASLLRSSSASWWPSSVLEYRDISKTTEASGLLRNSCTHLGCVCLIRFSVLMHTAAETRERAAHSLTPHFTSRRRPKNSNLHASIYRCMRALALSAYLERYRRKITAYCGLGLKARISKNRQNCLIFVQNAPKTAQNPSFLPVFPYPIQKDPLYLSPFIGDEFCPFLGKNRPNSRKFQQFSAKIAQTAEILQNSRIAFHHHFFERYTSNHH